MPCCPAAQHLSPPWPEPWMIMHTVRGPDHYTTSFVTCILVQYKFRQVVTVGSWGGRGWGIKRQLWMSDHLSSIY